MHKFKLDFKLEIHDTIPIFSSKWRVKEYITIKIIREKIK